MYLIVFLLGMPSILLSIEFVFFTIKGARLYRKYFIRCLEILGMFIFPLLYLYYGDFPSNDCCGESASFSPDHRLTFYFAVFLCVIIFFYSTFATEMGSPIAEIVINGILVFGFILNVFIGIHLGPIALFGNVPVGILLLLLLIQNHHKYLSHFIENNYVPETKAQQIAWRILNLNLLFKMPILLIACMPVLLFIMAFLLIAGQKPDSIIRAFTDTYKHGFSQLDYLCENVECGGHFLCSVAANGHHKVVKPIRYGSRHGHTIICNRQLLVANAFEELIERRLPRSHKIIRSQYNKVGNLIHKHYYVFNYKLVADVIYIMMKPLEYLFLMVLYTFDKQPENRIACQYMKNEDRSIIFSHYVSIPKGH